LAASSVFGHNQRSARGGDALGFPFEALQDGRHILDIELSKAGGAKTYYGARVS